MYVIVYGEGKERHCFKERERESERETLKGCDRHKKRWTAHSSLTFPLPHICRISADIQAL